MEAAFAVAMAKVLGIFYLAYGIGVLMNNKYYKNLADGMKNTAATFTMGFLLVLFGAFIVHSHNVRVRDWTVLVTLVGWGSLIKGFLLIAMPEMMAKMTAKKTKNMPMSVIGIIIIVLALVFLAFGFNVGA